MIKKILILFIILVFSLSFIGCCFTSNYASDSGNSNSSYGKFYGSINSNVYHYSSCRYVNQIKSNNLTSFSSVQNAKSRGYRPCKVCRPPG